MKNLKNLTSANKNFSFWFLLFAIYFAFCIFTTGLDLLKDNFCGSTAIDYCAYWSTGKIINDEGFSKIYDLDVLRTYQSPIYPRPFKHIDYFQIIPFPYLPIFAIPFSLLSLINLKLSFVIWVVINVFAFLLYLRFFTRDVSGEEPNPQLLILMLFSIPVFLNLSYGQLNIWLGIFAGEFVRNLIHKRPLWSGIWLAGLLLKPQTLIIVLPVLLVTKNYKVLLGFFINSILLFVGSFALAGKAGILGLINIVVGSSTGRSASNPLLMMNWRMLSMHLNNFSGTPLGSFILVFGVVVTLYLLYRTLKKVDLENQEGILLGYFAVFVATMLITWHAHFSQFIVAYPILVYFIQNIKLSNRLFIFWYVFPIIISFAIFFLPVVTYLVDTPNIQLNFLKFLAGSRGLILNLVFLIWAWWSSGVDPSFQGKVSFDKNESEG